EPGSQFGSWAASTNAEDSARWRGATSPRGRRARKRSLGSKSSRCCFDGVDSPVGRKPWNSCCRASRRTTSSNIDESSKPKLWSDLAPMPRTNQYIHSSLWAVTGFLVAVFGNVLVSRFPGVGRFHPLAHLDELLTAIAFGALRWMHGEWRWKI